MTRTETPSAAGQIPAFRVAPSPTCPGPEGLAAFVAEPLTIEPASYSHILRGCKSCRAGLRRLLLDVA